MKTKVLAVVLSIILNFNGSRILAQSDQQPNVIIILTDDQGYGDLGFTGNKHVKTPNLDQFAKKSIRFNNFHVSPVCAPTRSSLMTGRYSLRTGIRDTYNGGAIMSGNEVTIAEMLKDAGYETGIFGKWHLGDNYPSRPMDQGFDESVIHLAGGMGQVGDITTFFKGDSSYFDPVLWHNGTKEAYKGYCSDIFTDNAIDFIESKKDETFFCYLSFNAPHTPLQVPDKYYQLYKSINPAEGYSGGAATKMSEKDKEDARKVFAMLTNIDDNVGKVLAKLEALKIRKNTIVIFMTDNGPQQVRYIAGMRGRKSSVYRGGNRVPFFFSYPEKYKGNKDISTTSAHIDILPTLADLCKGTVPQDRIIDGQNLVPLLEENKVNWANRSLFFYWTRKYPELYNNMALQKGDYKLVAHADYSASLDAFELFNIKNDPGEENNILRENTSLATSLKAELDKKYQELITSKNLVDPPVIHIGSKEENPLILNRNDAGGQRAMWKQEEIYGMWSVKIEPGTYNFRYKFLNPVSPGGKMYLEAGEIILQSKNSATSDVLEMKNVSLPSMTTDLIPFYASKGKRILPFWVEVEKID
ncbi:MAG: arylsulfatase [Cyclobacteriaceae bacterium]